MPQNCLITREINFQIQFRLGSRKIDLNRSLSLYFVCPDGKIRLFLTKSNATFMRLVQEVALRMKLPANVS